MPKPSRLQGAFVSDQEIKKIVRFVKEKSGSTQYIEGVTEKQKVGGMGGTGLDTSGDDSDEYFEEAKETIINSGKASTTFLQRKLRIGYARAASLLDALEEAGVVGPSNGAKPREILITREQYEAVASMGVSGVSLHRREEAKAPEEFLESEDEEIEEDEEQEEEGQDDSSDEDNNDEEQAEPEHKDEDDSIDEEDVFTEEPEEKEESKKEKPVKKIYTSLDDKLFSR
jgi:hypothetical protein